MYEGIDNRRLADIDITNHDNFENEIVAFGLVARPVRGDVFVGVKPHDVWLVLEHHVFCDQLN